MTASLLLVLLVNALARELTARYPVGEVMFCRFAGAAAFLAVLSGGEIAACWRTPRLNLHLLRVALGVSATLALYVATRHLPFSDLMAIAYASPLIVALLSWPALGERVGLRRGFLILAGFGGILVVAFPGHFELWSLGALVMALLNAGALMATRQLGRSESAVTIGGCFALFGTVATAPMLLFGCELPGFGDALMFAALGGVAGLAIHLHAQAFRRAEAAVLAPIDYFAVVISPVFAWLFWAEVPSSSMMIGGSIIVTTGILQLREAHRAAAGNRADRIFPARWVGSEVASFFGSDALAAIVPTRSRVLLIDQHRGPGRRWDNPAAVQSTSYMRFPEPSAVLRQEWEGLR